MSVSQAIKEIFNDLASPNMVKTLVFSGDYILATFHDVPDNSEYLFIPLDSDTVKDLDLSEFLNDRAYNCVESVFIANDLVNTLGSDTLASFVQKGIEGSSRLMYVGAFEDSVNDTILDCVLANLSIEELSQRGINYNTIQEYDDAIRSYRLRPTDYPWDAQHAIYFETIAFSVDESSQDRGISSGDEEGSQEEATEEVEGFKEEVNEPTEELVEEEEPQEEVVLDDDEITPDERDFIEMNVTLFSSDIETIKKNYAYMFTAAYQLKRPYGIVTIENGEPQIITINGTSRVPAPKKSTLLNSPLVKRTINASGLTVCETRNVYDIAKLILTGKADNGETASMDARLYFPNKMLEFAYGLDKPKKTEGGRTNYPRHSQAKSWENYESEVVEDSLRDLFETVVLTVYRLKKQEGYLKPDSPEIQNTVMHAVRRLKESLLTCVMVAELSQPGGFVSLIKLKILNPYNLDISKNIATASVNEVFSMEDAIGTLSRAVVTEPDSKYYSVHTFEGNSKMAAASPLFAYKAADSLIKAGRPILYSEMILGIGLNDDIIQNGIGKVDYTRNITHYKIARSRAGKGVVSLMLLANAVKSGYPILYHDNKPDMASMLLELCEEVFAINGANSAVNLEGGTNIQKRFQREDYARWGKQSLIPEYLYSREGGIFASSDPSLYADFYYLRGVLFTMALIDCRVAIPEVMRDIYSSAGVEADGLVAFFDEFNNLNDSLRAFLDSAYRKQYANTAYYNEALVVKSKEPEILRKIEEKKSNGEKITKADQVPEIRAKMPSRSAYWMANLVEKVKSSADRIKFGKNAGYGNAEFAKSDIYIIGQELPDVITPETDLSQYYPMRSKTNNEVNAGDLKNLKSGYYPLAPLVAPFGQDIDVGYSDNNYLNQHYGFAKDKLNAQNRMFAYVPDYNPNTREKILKGDEQFASTVPTYYKPFLILPKEDTNVYYAKNALGFLNKVGLDIEEIIAENAEVDAEGNAIKGSPYKIEFIGGGSKTIRSGVRLNRAVGLEGYLNFIGLSKEDIQRNLSASGRLAQEVVDRLGYEGTWREFIIDMRAEYQFSIDDIKESLSTGVPLSSVTTVSSKEFYWVYEDAFSTSVAYDPDETMSDGGFENDAMSSLNRLRDDEPVSFDEIGFKKLPDNFGFENAKPVDEDGLKYETDYGSYIVDGTDPDNVTEFDKYDNLFKDIDLNKNYHDAGQNAQNVRLGIDDKIADIINAQAGGLSEEQKMRLFASLSDLYGNSQRFKPNNNDELEYGSKGTYYNRDGVSFKVDTDNIDWSNPENDKYIYSSLDSTTGSFNSLVEFTTRKVLEIGKRKGRIQNISVIGGTLVVDGILVTLNLGSNVINTFPSALRASLSGNLLAEYLDWSKVRRTGIYEINIDSSSYVFSRLCQSLGYNNGFNVQNLFSDFRSLRKVTLAGRVYTYKDVRNPEFHNLEDDFYQPRKTEQAYRLTQAWLRDRQVNTWGRSIDTWRRNDIGSFRKVAISSLNAAGAGASGVLRGANWLGRKGVRALGGMLRDVTKSSSGKWE